MNETIVILKVVLEMLPYVRVGADKLIDWVKTVREALIQRGEWTPELQEKFRATLWGLTAKPEYQPDQVINN